MMIRKLSKSIYGCLWCLFSFTGIALGMQDTVSFQVGMEERADHVFQVAVHTKIADGQSHIDFRMPVWSPGYYQVMDFGDKVTAFAAKGVGAGELKWEKLGKDTWRVYTDGTPEIRLDYTVLANRPFVGTAFVDTNRAFIKPAAVLMYVEGQLQRPVKLTLQPPAHWPDVATGLESVHGEPFAFQAPDFDILYDSPLLVSKLKTLPPFQVDGIEHRFLGYGMEAFDEKSLMDDIRKIVEASVELMGDIPYPHYTFIGLGPGQGGIEQLNSTAISFTGKGLDGPARTGILSFITHEYFHHYNVKRIRPIELGPFDYSQPNRTNLLWVAEGLTVYYENVVLSKAGLMSAQQILDDWAGIINRHENNAGRFKQTLAESSWNTWEDGPFGKPGETISYYVKGPIIGMLLDIEIRHITENKRSLDDVMRKLYDEYYKKEQRGFTEAEVRQVCEQIAGKSLDDIFRYIYTTDEIDYVAYFEKAGLDIRFATEQVEQGTVLRKPIITLKAQPNLLQQQIRNDLFGLSVINQQK